MISQFVNSEAKESSGAAGSDFVVLCCHLCFGFASLQHFNSVSSYSLVELESFGLQNIISEGITYLLNVRNNILDS